MSESLLEKWVSWARVCVLVPTIFLGIAVFVGFGIWLGVGSPWVDCVNLGGLKDWFVVCGVSMLISGLVSLVLCCCMAGETRRSLDGGDGDLKKFAGIYLCCGILVDIACLCVAIAVFSITKYSGSSHPASGRGYAEYRFNHFTPTFRKKVSNPLKWGSIITCLSLSDGCLALNKTYPSPQQLSNAPLTPLQFGCCMPPGECGFNFVNPTTWTSPTNNYTKGDCAIWSNEGAKFCFSCNSCKAGLLANISKNLRNTNKVLLVTMLLSFTLHVCSGILVFCVKM